MRPTVAEVIADVLYGTGVRHVFGQPGGEVVDLIEKLENRGIRFLLMGHESAAALAAGAVGHATGIPGVCLSTLGPGASNLTLGIADAFLDRHPVLAFSARTATHQDAWMNHQNLSLNQMFSPITKASVALDGTATAKSIQAALLLAARPPRGPVYLSLPADVAVQPDKGGTIDATLSQPHHHTDAPLSEISTALNQAKRPVVVLGTALDQNRDAAPIRRFLESTGLPHADTPKTKGLVDPLGSGYLGTCLSASGDSIINRFIGQSDFILGIGFDPVESTFDWHLGDRYHAITDGPTAYGSFLPQRQIIGDVGQLTERLAGSYVGSTTWKTQDFIAVRDQVRSAITPGEEASDAGMAPFMVVTALREVLPEDVLLAVDTGQHKMLFSQAWTTDRPSTYFNSNGLSSMGTSVPSAIALSVIHRDRHVVCVTGDGGFAMMVQELETVNRLGIQPCIVVLCDQALSLIRLPQQSRGYPRRAIDLAPVDWAAVAKGFGIRGEWANSEAELRNAVRRWRVAPSATVIAARIDESLYRGNQYETMEDA